MNKQQLASKIWESANKMRSKIEANEYKDYILGFIFYKFLSDKEVDYAKKEGWTNDDLIHLNESDTDAVRFCQDKLGYFIAYENLFSTWLNMGSDFNVSNVRDALSAFSRLIKPTHKRVFDKIFTTLETGLSKLGDNSGAQTKAISDLIQLIKVIPMDGKQDYDVLGFIYEYLIGMFAANAGKKGGEFYTPQEVSFLMSEIVAEHLKDAEKISIYDPTSGSGSLLINIGKSVAKRMNDKNNIKYYAQEVIESTYNLTRMNLVMRGILPDNICVRNGDTLKEDWPYFDESDPQKTYNPLYVDAVVSNPPYSQHWEPPTEADARYARYGIAPQTKADYAFLLHDLYHIKPDGIMTIVLPHGVLFRGGEEGEIRKNLIENNNIDTVIGLPANLFFGTGIPTIIMVLKQRRPNTDILFIDASKGFEKAGKQNKLRASDIKRIVDVFITREDVTKFSRKVSRDEIRANEYNLNIPRYVDSSEKAEPWDIFATIFGGIPQSEIDELAEYWEAFPTLQRELFAHSNSAYCSVAVENINDTITANSDVQKFVADYKAAFSDFAEYLKTKLVDGIATVAVSKEETVIADNIFARLQPIPLIDRYIAYQHLNDSWIKISADLEMIQTEGFETVKKTDPRMVQRKGKGKDEEVQEGWIGRIIPFELVQSTLLSEQKNRLNMQEARLSDISAECDEILESFTEEEKTDNSDLLTEDNDSFVASAVSKKAKALMRLSQQYDEDSIEGRIVRLNTLFEEEKQLKRETKRLSEKLTAETKATIEGLTDEQAKDLLVKKWIEPLVAQLGLLPNYIVSALENRINALTKKYSVTMLDVECEIDKAEREFSAMIDELEGDEYDLKGLRELQKMLKGE